MYEPYHADRNLEEQVKWAVNTLGYLDSIDIPQRVNRIREREEKDVESVKGLVEKLNGILGDKPKEISDNELDHALETLVAYDQGLQYSQNIQLKGSEKEYAKAKFLERLETSEDAIKDAIKNRFASEEHQGRYATLVRRASLSSASRLHQYCLRQIAGSGYLRGESIPGIREAYGISEEQLPWYADTADEIIGAISARNREQDEKFSQIYPPKEQVEKDKAVENVRRKVREETEEGISEWERQQGKRFAPEKRRQILEQATKEREEELIRQRVLPPEMRQPMGPQQPQPGFGPSGPQQPGIPGPMGGGPAGVPQPQQPAAPPPGG